MNSNKLLITEIQDLNDLTAQDDSAEFTAEGDQISSHEVQTIELKLQASRKMDLRTVNSLRIENNNETKSLSEQSPKLVIKSK